MVTNFKWYHLHLLPFYLDYSCSIFLEHTFTLESSMLPCTNRGSVGKQTFDLYCVYCTLAWHTINFSKQGISSHLLFSFMFVSWFLANLNCCNILFQESKWSSDKSPKINSVRKMPYSTSWQSLESPMMYRNAQQFLLDVPENWTIYLFL